VIPFTVLLGLLGIVWLVFGDRIVEETTEEASTELLGAHVELEGVRIDETRTSLGIRVLRVADPLDPMRNLIELSAVAIALEPVPLLEKKIVIRRIAIDDVRFNTQRATPAPPAPPDGFAAQTLGGIRAWAGELRRPLLAFTPIDTIRSIVLDPTQLGTVQSALALRAEADSVQRGVREGFEGLRLRETLDSAQALAQRLEGTNVRTLGLEGARRAVQDIRRTIARIDSARTRVESLEQNVRGGVATLGGGVRALDAARRADYEFARGLLQLPSFEGPDLGNALFGEVSLDRMQQAVYWASLAEQYMPPGLRPRPDDGPQRARAAGLTVRFPKAREYPAFHLRRGDARFTIGDGDASNAYTFVIANVTSAPALVGAPVRFVARQVEGSAGTSQLDLAGMIDHAGDRLRDSVRAVAAGISLPSFELPGLPFRVEPGKGATSFTFERDGEQLSARWAISSNEVAWIADTTRFDASNQLESLLGRVLAGLNDLQIEARLTGTMREPQLSVRSNLDRALSDRLEAVAGEELRRAEARVRAEVDRIVTERVEPVKTYVGQVQAEAEQRVAEAKARLDEEKRKLEERLRALSGGIIGLP
jgi:uncharacterized protein (TIGR03545 family)